VVPLIILLVLRRKIRRKRDLFTLSSPMKDKFEPELVIDPFHVIDSFAIPPVHRDQNGPGGSGVASNQVSIDETQSRVQAKKNKLGPLSALRTQASGEFPESDENPASLYEAGEEGVGSNRDGDIFSENNNGIDTCTTGDHPHPDPEQPSVNNQSPTGPRATSATSIDIQRLFEDLLQFLARRMDPPPMAPDPFRDSPATESQMDSPPIYRPS